MPYIIRDFNVPFLCFFYHIFVSCPNQLRHLLIFVLPNFPTPVAMVLARLHYDGVFSLALSRLSVFICRSTTTHRK